MGTENSKREKQTKKLQEIQESNMSKSHVVESMSEVPRRTRRSNHR